MVRKMTEMDKQFAPGVIEAAQRILDREYVEGVRWFKEVWAPAMLERSGLKGDDVSAFLRLWMLIALEAYRSDPGKGVPAPHTADINMGVSHLSMVLRQSHEKVEYYFQVLNQCSEGVVEFDGIVGGHAFLRIHFPKLWAYRRRTHRYVYDHGHGYGAD